MGILYASDSDKGGWYEFNNNSGRLNEFPISFRMDRTGPPLSNGQNSDANYLKQISEAWNDNPEFGNRLNIDLACVAGGTLPGGSTCWPLTQDPLDNDRNEIHFHAWDQNLMNISDYDMIEVLAFKRGLVSDDPSDRISTPDYNSQDHMTGADIYFNPYFYSQQRNNYLTDNQITTNCLNNISIELVLLHEIGHALGLPRHSIHEGLIMSSSAPFCVKGKLDDEAWSLMRKMYFGNRNVSVNISSPYKGETLIVNQSRQFSATVASLRNNNKIDLSQSQNTLSWKSSVDGELGVGNNIDVINLSAGLHNITVTYGAPNEGDYGVSDTFIYVLDSVTDIIDVFGNVIASPFPCPRAVNSSDGACLFTVKQFISFGNCIYTLSQSTTYVEDLLAGAELGSGNRFVPHREAFPICDPDPLAGYYYDIESWIYDTVNPDQVNYHLFNSTSRVGQIIDATYHYFYNVPLVEPEIYVTPLADCNVTNPSQKCSVSINYQDKYFLPDAAIFYRDLGTADWTPLYSFPPGSDGSINTGNIVSSSGTEIAIFQYGSNVYGADRPFPQAPIITAPNGLVAGPFLVKATSSNTTPTVPELVSAETACSNNYCITLLGRYFDLNSHVEIRENINGGTGDLLKQITGNDIYARGSVDGFDRIHFPLQDLSLQDKLNNNGLCFIVVNDSELSDGICVTRPTTPPATSFMGKAVGFYLFNNEDKEYTSYEVLGNPGNKLKIWGNSWKKIYYPYNVTPHTVLEFDFKSNKQQAEINGIGFIKSGGGSLVTEKWQVYGTEVWGHQDYHNYSGTQWKSYSIPVGQNFTGQILFMVFAGDEDNHVGQNTLFRNPRLVEVDIYEEDDTPLSNTNVNGINQLKQHHDFSDDSVDWIKLTDSVLGVELDIQPDACNNLSCGIELSNIENVDLCLQFYGNSGSSQTRCGLTNGYFTDNNLVVSSTGSSPAPSQCDTDYMLGWSHVKLFDNDNSPDVNKKYDIKFTCNYDSVPDRVPDIYEDDDTVSTTTNVISVNGIKQHHNFKDDRIDKIILPSIGGVISELGLNPNESCDNLSCKIKISNQANIDLCYSLVRGSSTGPFPGSCAITNGHLSQNLIDFWNAPTQCSSHEMYYSYVSFDNDISSGSGSNKSYDVELICTNN